MSNIYELESHCLARGGMPVVHWDDRTEYVFCMGVGAPSSGANADHSQDCVPKAPAAPDMTPPVPTAPTGPRLNPYGL